MERDGCWVIAYSHIHIWAGIEVMESQDENDTPSGREEVSIDGQFRIKISSDSMTVSLYQLTPPVGDGKPVTVEAIMAKLSKSRISYGIDHDAIEGALSALEQGSPPEKPVEIVHGLKPVHGDDAEITWFIGTDTEAGNTQVVLPGQLVAIMQAAGKGEVGKDIYGKPVRTRAGMPLSLKAGEGVSSELKDKGYEYRAEWLGVMEYDNDQLSIHPPALEVAEDSLSAHMDIPVHAAGEYGGNVEPEHIMAVLSKLGIHHGIDEAAIRSALEQARAESADVISRAEVARGTPVEHGQNASIRWHVDVQGGDESARVLIPGQLIAESTPATKGNAGKDVYGKAIDPKPGEEPAFKPGDGVDVSTADGQVEYRAKWMGIVSISEDTLVVATPPVQVAEDRLSATMDIYAHSGGEQGGKVEAGHIVAVLKKAKISHGINEEDIAEILSEAQNADGGVIRDAIVASGTPPVHGEEGSITWYVDIENENECNRVVIPGELVAVHKIASKGTAGKDIYAKPVRPESGSDTALMKGMGVSTKSIEGGEGFFADALGIVSLANSMLNLQPLGVQVSEDGLEARMDVYARSVGEHGGDVEVKHVLDVLGKAKVTHGIDEGHIADILTQARTAEGGFLPQAVVAHGTPAVNGENGVIEWHVDIDKEDEQSRVVLPWQLIATHRHATKGKAGMSVYGKATSPAPGAEVSFARGDGIEAVEIDGGEEFRSVSLGIVEQRDGKVISRVPALSVSEDGLSASMDIYARSGGRHMRDVEAKHITATLEKNGIVFGINEQLIQQTLDRLRSGKSDTNNSGVERNVVVASGIDKRDGVPASINLNHESIPGLKHKDGHIDLHEHGYPWDVKKGMVLGKFTPAVEARDGTRVTGESIHATEVENVSLELSGIHLEQDGHFVADEDGSLLVNGFNLMVTDVVVINGDVDLHSGNIHTRSTVQVKGFVTPGFIIEAGGDVIIDENVEDAIVRAVGNIIIKGGIRGPRAQVFSSGSITVGFIEYGKVIAKDSIEIARSAVDAHITAGKDVLIGPEPGTMISGHCEAIRQVVVKTIGHPTSHACEIRLGMSEKRLQRLHGLQGRKDLSPVEIAERNFLQQLEGYAEYAALRVSGKIESDVVLHIGSEVIKIQDEVSYHDYYIDPEQHKITFRAYDENSPVPRAHKKPHDESHGVIAEELNLDTA